MTEMDKYLLTPEERSEVIQRDTTLWCPTKGEFLDEVGEVIAKAQLQKDEARFATEKAEFGMSVHEAAMGLVEQEKQEGIDAGYSLALQHCEDVVIPQAVSEAVKAERAIWQNAIKGCE